MSELEELVSLIYHEKQESGSMLCAQHALNSLLRAFAPTGCLESLDGLIDVHAIYRRSLCVFSSRDLYRVYSLRQLFLKFTAPDLSVIARNMDLLEEQYNTTSEHNGSKNMDDTGKESWA